MNFDSLPSFINCILVGAGAVIAVMAFSFLHLVGRYEGMMGVTTIEIRAAIILGSIVCTAALGYEFYSKRSTKEQCNVNDE